MIHPYIQLAIIAALAGLVRFVFWLARTPYDQQDLPGPPA